ncbi:MAG: class I SAM-dependent methyltransferase [Dehalococcoidia bacterium]|nr:class I SAM-dependent methyltransferase [Dehalococcoidia bacterium]
MLDVGAGAGRYALPLALCCRHVTAVEPSPAMGKGFRAVAAEAGIANVSLVQAAWEEANVRPADVALCSNVLYTLRDAEAFIRKLDRHARARRCWSSCTPRLRSGRPSTARSACACPRSRSCWNCSERWIATPTWRCCRSCRAVAGNRGTRRSSSSWAPCSSPMAAPKKRAWNQRCESCSCRQKAASRCAAVSLGDPPS